MKKIFGLVTVLLVALSVAACGKKEEEFFFKDNQLKIEMATIDILGSEVLPADEAAYRNKPQIVFTYEITNDSEEDIQSSTVWIACFEATQDGGDTNNKLSVGMTPSDEKFAEYREHELDNIKPGGKAKGVIAYDLDDTETPVVLKATQGFAGKELGEQEFKLK